MEQTHLEPVYSPGHSFWRAIYPTILYFVVTTAVTVIGALFYVAAALAATGATITDSNVIIDLVFQVMNDQLMPLMLIGQIGGLIIFVPMWARTRRRYRLWNGGRLDIGNILLIIVFAVASYFAISYTIGLLSLDKVFESYSNVEVTLSSGTFLMQALAIGITGPILEELCFRGVTLNRLSNNKMWVAIIIQALMFGVAHGNMLQGMYATVLGLIFGRLYVLTKTIWAPIIAHIAFNMTNVVLVEIANRSSTAAAAAEDIGAYDAATYVAISILILVAAGIATACYFIIKRRTLGKNHNDDDHHDGSVPKFSRINAEHDEGRISDDLW